MLNRFFQIIAILVCLAFSSIALAAPTELHSENLPSRPDIALEVSLNESPGVWLPTHIAHQNLMDVEELHELRLQISLLQQQNSIREERISILKERAEVQLKITDSYKSAFAEQVSLRREAEESRDDLFAGKPVVFVLVGIAGTLLSIVLLK